MIRPTKIEHDSVTFSKTCQVTDNIFNVKIPLSAYNRWIKGELIQNVFPQLDDDEREFLVTGMTPAERGKLFGE